MSHHSQFTRSRLLVVVPWMCAVLLLVASGCDSSMLKSGDRDVDAGMMLVDKRDFAGAIVPLKKAIESPLRRYSKSNVLSQIGVCYTELDQFDEAFRYLDQAITEDPKNHQALVNKGIACRQKGDLEQAEELYNKALKLQPNYAELHASLGALYVFQKRFDDAVRSLERAVELDPSLPVAHSNLAFAYATVGRFDDADAQIILAKKTGYHQPEVIEKYIERMRNGKTDRTSDSP